jgi:hypothetical protein
VQGIGEIEAGVVSVKRLGDPFRIVALGMTTCPLLDNRGGHLGEVRLKSKCHGGASLKRTVEDNSSARDAYGYVRVRGEVSGYRGPHSSGHVYFALKDESAKIDAVIWKGVFGRMRLKPEEGLEVIVTGRITTYPGRSNYQIVIETLEPAGVGALMALLEERKRKKLAAEGLFDEARKQLLPFLPTSRSASSPRRRAR